VCISFGRIKFNEAGEPRAQIISYAGEDEANILTQAFTLINQFTAVGSKLVGHNIKRFDIPYLCKRAYINKIEPATALQVWDMKPWEIPVVDTSDIWSFGAWQEGFSSLDLIATVLGHPSPKDEMHGSQVHSNFYAGNITEIQKYCQKDVVSVINIAISLANLNQLEEYNIIYK
jgi:predicted PolB exonuclease-like 3'-5' exonuclease